MGQPDCDLIVDEAGKEAAMSTELTVEELVALISRYGVGETENGEQIRASERLHEQTTRKVEVIQLTKGQCSALVCSCTYASACGRSCDAQNMSGGQRYYYSLTGITALMQSFVLWYSSHI